MGGAGGNAGGGGGSYSTPHISVTSGGLVTVSGNATIGSISYTPPAFDLKTAPSFSNQPVEGSEFHKATELYLTDIEISPQSNGADNWFLYFHLKVWLETVEYKVQDYGPVLKGDRCILAFGSRESRSKFNAWKERYQKVFYDGADLNTVRLPFPKHGELQGIHVGEGERYDRIPTEMETWAWITENSHHPVTRINTGWLFSNLNDAVLFKMR